MNLTEFAQKINLPIKVPDVVPSSDEKITFLQMCQMKKVATLLLKKLFETLNFPFMKTLEALSKKTSLGYFFYILEINVTRFCLDQVLDSGQSA